MLFWFASVQLTTCWILEVGRRHRSMAFLLWSRSKCPETVQGWKEGRFPWSLRAFTERPHGAWKCCLAHLGKRRCDRKSSSKETASKKEWSVPGLVCLCLRTQTLILFTESSIRSDVPNTCRSNTFCVHALHPVPTSAGTPTLFVAGYHNWLPQLVPKPMSRITW